MSHTLAASAVVHIMKVIDPQSALLTNAEVYDFLKSSKPRTADKKIGAYEPVDLKGYKEVRQDVCLRCTSCHVDVIQG